MKLNVNTFYLTNLTNKYIFNIFSVWNLFILTKCLVFCVTNPENTLNASLIFPKTEKSDVILGSLFPIHALPTFKNPESCGQLQEEDGILPLEAFLYTIDQVNDDPSLLPGIKLGVLALDSCDSPDIALQQSLRFIKGFIASQNTHHEAEFRCTDNSTPVYDEGHYDKVVGVIGGQHSSVSVQIANVLRLFKVPQISYRSTSASLSQRDRYPYFLRTVPTDNNQAEVILKVLEYLNVSYASLVYSATEYGKGGYNELLQKAKSSSVCFATPAHALRPEDPDEEYDAVLKALVERKKAKVVVLFSDIMTATKLFKAAGNSTQFLWVGSDGWTSQIRELEKYNDVIEGAIGIQLMSKTLPGFGKYFKGLNPDSNKRNPWFKEYWQQHFNCTLQEKNSSCSNNSLKHSKKFVNSKLLHFVRDSVYAFAHGLHELWKANCMGELGLCTQMAHDGHVHGHELYDYIRNVTFKDVTNQTFRFLDSGAGTPRYTVFGYRKKKSPPMDHGWVPIGNFSYENDQPSFMFSEEQAKWREDDKLFPESICGRPCGSQQVKMVDEDTCCWRCKNCSHNQYLDKEKNFCETCNSCKKANGSRCIDKPDRYLDYMDHWAITSMAFASLGIFSTIFVGVIFWVHLDTPVIRAASRELSYILLAGILMSFFMTFALLAPPTNLSCGFTRFFLGFSYTLCYSAILTKTNRISRIFNKNPAKSVVKTRYTSPKSQMVIVLLLVCIEIIINICWLMFYPPENKQICASEQNHNTLICKGIEDISYMVGFIYPLFLVCLCTIYAIKTRKCPGGFNEARYIAFTNYTTCVIWLVFVPLYLTTPAKDPVKIVSLAMSLSLGGFVQLGCLFFPKVHIVLFKPEKNTRDAVMSQPRGSSLGVAGPTSVAIKTLHHSAPSMVYINGAGSSTYPVPKTGHKSTSTPSTVTFMGTTNEARDRNSIHTLGNINPVYLSVPNPDK